MEAKKRLCQVFIFVAIWTGIFAECWFPEKEFLHGQFIHQTDSEANLTHAPNRYILRFRCDEGFQLTQPQIVICIDGNWTAEFPFCGKLDCPKPPLLQHGSMDIERGTLNNPVVGSKVIYSCLAGYKMRNENETTLSCVMENKTAVWTGALSSCIQKESACPDPDVPPQGSRSGQCCSTGSVVTYSCKRRYKLVGDDSIKCLPDGTWSAHRPRCRPNGDVCPDPPLIENGVVVGSLEMADYYSPFDEVEIVCNTGYAFHGENKYVLCEADLNWDVKFGECRETFCPRPDIPANGTIVELESTNSTEFADQFELTYQCNDGYRIQGDDFRSCNKGKWSGKEPQCKEIRCYEPNIPENGERNGDDFRIGSTVVFSCQPPYQLYGSVERFCLPNGQWSGLTASCDLQSNHCPNPGVPINGKKNGSRFREGDKVEFSCYPGFTLIGPGVRQCLQNGSWSEEEPKCLGAHDFDNKDDISEILQEKMEHKAEMQAMDVEEYETAVKNIDVNIARGKTLDLNYPGRLVLYFMFDVSGSVRKNNFKTSIRFAKALVKKVGVSQNGARVGALTFSSKAVVSFLPPQHATTEDVVNALNKIEFENGATATSSALQVVREEMIPLSREYFGYMNVKSVVFILTDGKANTGGTPKYQAQLLKEAGVEIYCVGVTGDIKKNGLYELASKPHDEHVFVLDNYKTLEWLVQEVTNGTIDYSQCGLGLEKLAKGKQQARIIGGKKVIEAWPWMAALYFKVKGARNVPFELKCGGSIISQQYIMTAAHCLEKDGVKTDKKDVTIRLGLQNVDDAEWLQEFEVEEIIPHPQYNSDIFDYDIALIKLNRLIEYNPYVRPICLPPKDLAQDSRLYGNHNAFAAGWGYDQKMGINTKPGSAKHVNTLKDLKELQLPIQNKSICLKSLLDLKYAGEKFTERMFCAGKGDGLSDTCVGDSGGPLMQSQINSGGHIYWTQIGIVSWGPGCGQENTFGIYTHVQNIISWVQSKLNTA